MRKTTVEHTDSAGKVHRTTYTGFDGDFNSPHKLVLVRDECQVIQFALDKSDDCNGCNGVLQDSVDSLCAYIEDNHPWMRIMGTYEESGFRGFKLNADFAG